MTPTLTLYALSMIAQYEASGWNELGGVVTSEEGQAFRVDYTFDTTGQFTGATFSPISAEDAERVRWSYQAKQDAIAAGRMQAAVVWNETEVRS